jgi:hypothetical protein
MFPFTLDNILLGEEVMYHKMITGTQSRTVGFEGHATSGHGPFSEFHAHIRQARIQFYEL